jgi:predicted nucleic acid-binding protein
VIIVDASVLAPALSDDSDEGDRLQQCLRGQTVTASELVDLEVQSVLRSLDPLRGRSGSAPAGLSSSATIGGARD